MRLCAGAGRKFFLKNYLKNKEEAVSNLAYDQTFVDSHRMKEFIETTDKRTVYAFRYSESVVRFFEGQKFYFVDKWGRMIDSKENAVEVLVANF